MAISDQFRGLDMKNLIGGPLSAAADASLALANSTATFINTVGFDERGRTRTVKFGYQQTSQNDDGTTNNDEMNVDIPLLAITPIPNLQIDNVDVLFDMEVKETSKSESSNDLSASGSATIGFLGFKMTVTGSVSAHQSNTRSSDNSAKYHVEVNASNYGTPEGLARVLDMMAANISPALISSTPKDANGQDLTKEKREKVERRKQLSLAVSDLERQVNAARNVYNERLTQFRRIASAQLNEYLARISNELSAQEEKLKGLDPSKDADYQTNKSAIDETIQKITNMRDEVIASWNNFQNNLEGLMNIVADTSDTSGGISSVFGLKMPQLGEKDSIKAINFANNDSSQYDAMLTIQNKSVDDKKKMTALENSLSDKKREYNLALTE